MVWKKVKKKSIERKGYCQLDEYEISVGFANILFGSKLRELFNGYKNMCIFIDRENKKFAIKPTYDRSEYCLKVKPYLCYSGRRIASLIPEGIYTATIEKGMFVIKYK